MLADQVLADRENTHFDVRRALAGEDLVVPDHVLHVERDLLAGLVAHQVVDLLRVLLQVDRRHLAKPRERLLPRHADDEAVVLPLVAGSELLQGRGNQLVAVGVGLREDFGVFDDVEGDGLELAVRGGPQLEGLQRTLPDVDAPHGIASSHSTTSVQRSFRLSAVSSRSSVLRRQRAALGAAWTAPAPSCDRRRWSSPRPGGRQTPRLTRASLMRREVRSDVKECIDCPRVAARGCRRRSTPTATSGNDYLCMRPFAAAMLLSPSGGQSRFQDRIIRTCRLAYLLLICLTPLGRSWFLP